ncbi:MAG: hypothetical protein EP330_13865 [Deltaproteobacteria bacterium]|nr:MAG: hypothetical protein EP330_13865 [Deltaproteobacteria bacterium]
MRNRFGNPKANNYRDLQVMVKLSGEVLGEIQFHMRGIMDIMNGPEHHWYEIKQKRLKEGLIDDVPDVVEKGDQHFAEQYQNAYDQYGQE